MGWVGWVSGFDVARSGCVGIGDVRWLARHGRTVRITQRKCSGMSHAAHPRKVGPSGGSVFQHTGAGSMTWGRRHVLLHA